MALFFWMELSWLSFWRWMLPVFTMRKLPENKEIGRMEKPFVALKQYGTFLFAWNQFSQVYCPALLTQANTQLLSGYINSHILIEINRSTLVRLSLLLILLAGEKSKVWHRSRETKLPCGARIGIIGNMSYFLSLIILPLLCLSFFLSSDSEIHVTREQTKLN